MHNKHAGMIISNDAVKTALIVNETNTIVVVFNKVLNQKKIRLSRFDRPVII